MRILRRHDGLLVERLTLRARTCEFEPQLGQLVVAVFPKNCNHFVCRRIRLANPHHSSSIHEYTIYDYSLGGTRKRQN